MKYRVFYLKITSVGGIQGGAQKVLVEADVEASDCSVSDCGALLFHKERLGSRNPYTTMIVPPGHWFMVEEVEDA
jgi:hypothetical protein